MGHTLVLALCKPTLILQYGSLSPENKTVSYEFFSGLSYDEIYEMALSMIPTINVFKRAPKGEKEYRSDHVGYVITHAKNAKGGLNV